MIRARIFKNRAGGMYGFSIESHGSGIVCAAVSVLAQNTVNSIERFAGGRFACDYDESGGYLRFEHGPLKNGEASHDAELLLKAMALGLYGIEEEYGDEIKITEEAP